MPIETEITPQKRGDFEKRVRQMKGEFTRNDFPDLATSQVTNALNTLKRAGKLKLIRKATIGRFGTPAVYRVK